MESRQENMPRSRSGGDRAELLSSRTGAPIARSTKAKVIRGERVHVQPGAGLSSSLPTASSGSVRAAAARSAYRRISVGSELERPGGPDAPKSARHLAANAIDRDLRGRSAAQRILSELERDSARQLVARRREELAVSNTDDIDSPLSDDSSDTSDSETSDDINDRGNRLHERAPTMSSREQLHVATRRVALGDDSRRAAETESDSSSESSSSSEDEIDQVQQLQKHRARLLHNQLEQNYGRLKPLPLSQPSSSSELDGPEGVQSVASADEPTVSSDTDSSDSDHSAERKPLSRKSSGRGATLSTRVTSTSTSSSSSSSSSDEGGAPSSARRLSSAPAPKSIAARLETVHQQVKEAVAVRLPRRLNFVAGAHSQQCKPRVHSNEDRFVVHPRLHDLAGTREPVALVAVADGHGGASTSEFIKHHLAAIIVSQPDFGTDFAKCLRSAFLQLDEELIRRGKMSSGACLCCCLVTSDCLYVANAGDCRLVLFNPTMVGKLSYPITTDHKASDPKEKKRIADAGGLVFKGRVFGMLAVARAIGDFEFKAVKNDGKDFVVAIPDVFVIRRAKFPGLTGVGIASDGVWDVMENDEVCKLLMGAGMGRIDPASKWKPKIAASGVPLKKDGVTREDKVKDSLSEAKLRVLARQVTEEAARRGSRDDCTFIAAMFS